MSSFFPYLIPYLCAVPYYVIWLSGIVYAFAYRHRHPRTSLFAGLALALMLIDGLTSVILDLYFQYQAINNQDAAGEWLQRSTTLALCFLPVGMTSWALLFVALFGRKNLTESVSYNKDIS